MVTVVFDSMGEAVRLALVADEYVGGGLAVLLLDATDPRSEGYMTEWGVLTVNVPAAAEWCRGRGNIAVDADAPAALLEALETAVLASIYFSPVSLNRRTVRAKAVSPVALTYFHRFRSRLDGPVPRQVLQPVGPAGYLDQVAVVAHPVRDRARRREVRGRRAVVRRRMGCRPGRFRGCRDHRLRDGPDGLHGRGGIATAATRTGMPATACPCGVSRGGTAPSPDPCAPKGRGPLGPV